MDWTLVVFLPNLAVLFLMKWDIQPVPFCVIAGFFPIPSGPPGTNSSEGQETPILVKLDRENLYPFQ